MIRETGKIVVREFVTRPPTLLRPSNKEVSVFSRSPWSGIRIYVLEALIKKVEISLISSAGHRLDKELDDEVIQWNTAITSWHVLTPKECLRGRLAKNRIKLTDFFTHCTRLYFEIRHEISVSDTVCKIVVWNDISPPFSNDDTCEIDRKISYDATAIITVFQSNEPVAMLVFQSNPVEV